MGRCDETSFGGFPGLRTIIISATFHTLGFNLKGELMR